MLFFKPMIQIWVNFGGFCNGRRWYSLWPFGIVYGHLLYVMAIWYILWSFGVHILWPFGVHILWPFGIFSPIFVSIWQPWPPSAQ
jgi:hypothetical protein